jgi:hypothetical protein
MIGSLIAIDIFAAAILNFFAAVMNFFKIDIEVYELINPFIIIFLTTPILSLDIAVLRLMWFLKKSVVRMSRFLKNWYYWMGRLVFHNILARMIKIILTVYRIPSGYTASITAGVNRKLLFWKTRIIFLFAVL